MDRSFTTYYFITLSVYSTICIYICYRILKIQICTILDTYADNINPSVITNNNYFITTKQVPTTLPRLSSFWVKK